MNSLYLTFYILGNKYVCTLFWVRFVLSNYRHNVQLLFLLTVVCSYTFPQIPVSFFFRSWKKSIPGHKFCSMLGSPETPRIELLQVVRDVPRHLLNAIYTLNPQISM
jgi:hypothetical protein